MTAKTETAAEVLAEIFTAKHRATLEEWADRLERALSAQGEAVAAYRLRTGAPRTRWQWMDGKPSAGAIQEAELHGWEIEYAYTHPAPARVTEEMVERALTALRSREIETLGGTKTPNNGARRDCMRAAITAALEAETSRALTASLNVVKRLHAERDALVREVEALRAIPEKIAQGWDGCYYDDGLSEDTIGDRIRHDASRLIDAAREEVSNGNR